MVRSESKVKKGAFQCMGLDARLLRGIFACGYKQPTPIQRKIIPKALAGSDILAMARTGSGKTAAFLIPLLNHLIVERDEQLNCDFSKVGSKVRALILSPTRELAIQTFGFLTKIGRYVTNVSAALITGGNESLDNQFDLLTNSCPKILVATIGRLLHLCVEMDLEKFENVKYLVLDEADRLFEQAEECKRSDALVQINEILKRLPSSCAAGKQTILVSATLPRQLIQFASGLAAFESPPVVIRLDSDMRLSPYLSQINYLVCRNYEHKLSVLVSMMGGDGDVGIKWPCAIFVATKHDVELVCGLLDDKCLGIVKCSGLYGSMDQDARDMSLHLFLKGRTQCLVVTDLAARGIDIPALDCLINLNFPDSPKLFVHRIGRVARKPSKNGAFVFCLMNVDEIPRLFDLHKLLGYGYDQDCRFKLSAAHSPSYLQERISRILGNGGELADEAKKTRNGHSAYLRSCH